MRLSNFQVLTFDCYGTLVDWESGMVQALRPLIDRSGLNLTRNEILQAHARHESMQQRQTPAMPYRQLLAVVYKRLAEEWDVRVTWAECTAYGSSVKDWPAFADSPASLLYLKDHFKLVVLSNIDNESFSKSNEKLDVAFDAVYTAEDIGAYKPSDRNFEYMIEHLEVLGYGKESILHTAESLFHDHAPANRHGLASCWIYRRHADEGFGATMPPGRMPEYAFRFNGMAELVEAHRKESN